MSRDFRVKDTLKFSPNDLETGPQGIALYVEMHTPLE